MTRTVAQTNEQLYGQALQADTRYSATIAARTDGRRDRWTMTAQDRALPEVQAAYRDKVQADEVWLMWLRTAGHAE